MHLTKSQKCSSDDSWSEISGNICTDRWHTTNFAKFVWLVSNLSDRNPYEKEKESPFNIDSILKSHLKPTLCLSAPWCRLWMSCLRWVSTTIVPDPIIFIFISILQNQFGLAVGCSKRLGIFPQKRGLKPPNISPCKLPPRGYGMPISRFSWSLLVLPSHRISSTSTSCSGGYATSTCGSGRWPLSGEGDEDAGMTRYIINFCGSQLKPYESP